MHPGLQNWLFSELCPSLTRRWPPPIPGGSLAQDPGHSMACLSLENPVLSRSSVPLPYATRNPTGPQPAPSYHGHASGPSCASNYSYTSQINSPGPGSQKAESVSSSSLIPDLAPTSSFVVGSEARASGAGASVKQVGEPKAPPMPALPAIPSALARKPLFPSTKPTRKVPLHPAAAL